MDTLISTKLKGEEKCVRNNLDSKICKIFRIVSAVYEMIGKEDDVGKAQELFQKMDQNSDGHVSQDEFIAIIKQDESLLSILQGKA